MDLLSVGAWFVVMFKTETCEKPLHSWYAINGIWATLSFAFTVWYSYRQLKRNYQTKRAITITYIFEAGYLILSIWAWGILSSEDAGGECAKHAAGLLELLVDMIILLYMRSLRLLSIVLFLIICGPLLLVCWWKNRPKPTEDPAALRAQLVKVSISQLTSLRAMDYRHSGSTSSRRRSSSVMSEQSSVDMSDSLVGEYEAALPRADMTCCICMEDFSATAPSQSPDDLEDTPVESEVVVLPCKAHFFHEECISQWITKQNACPICRQEITLAQLKQ